MSHSQLRQPSQAVPSSSHADGEAEVPKPTGRFTRWQQKIEESQQRQRDGPDNIVAAKFAVALCVALLIWVFYVYVGRIVYPMLKMAENRRGSRSEGIVFLIFFVILWLLMSYSYAAVCWVSPGFAKDYVQQGPSPEPPLILQPQKAYERYEPNGQPSQASDAAPWSHKQLSATAIGKGQVQGDSGLEMQEKRPTSRPDSAGSTLVGSQQLRSSRSRATAPPTTPSDELPAMDFSSATGTGSSQVDKAYAEHRSLGPVVLREDPIEEIAEKRPQAGAAGPNVGKVLSSMAGEKVENGKERDTASSAEQGKKADAGLAAPSPPRDTSLPPSTRERPVSSSDRTLAGSPALLQSASAVPSGTASGIASGYEIKKKEGKTVVVSREPPLSAPLHSYARYCTRDSLVKPYRTHHCRRCGTCVLNMDHHCPWVGQCVGAHNHIYFVTFCFWACIALFYIFLTCLISLVPPNISPRPRVDGQIVAICGIAFFLSFFTFNMAVTHFYLILLNQSTIENIAISEMKRRERSRLQNELGLFHLGEKKRILRSFDEEWGNLNTEQNLWYLGSKKLNWQMTMGTKIIWWVIPKIGRKPYQPDTGLEYKPNPRRGEEGVWRRRAEWPMEYR